MIEIKDIEHEEDGSHISKIVSFNNSGYIAIRIIQIKSQRRSLKDENVVDIYQMPNGNYFLTKDEILNIDIRKATECILQNKNDFNGDIEIHRFWYNPDKRIVQVCRVPDPKFDYRSEIKSGFPLQFGKGEFGGGVIYFSDVKDFNYAHLYLGLSI